ncbi:MAG: hypothetical protein AAF447_04355 [Myxococcota bacterium]
MGTDEVKNDTSAAPDVAEVLRRADAAAHATRERLDAAGEPTSGASRRRMTRAGAKLIVGSFTAGCVYFLVALPKPVLPREAPALRLDAQAAAAVAQADARAASALTESEALTELRGLVDAQRRREARSRELSTGDAPDTTHGARMEALGEAAAVLRDAGGEETLDGFVAEGVAGLRAVLAGGLEPGDEAGRVGSFPRMLERYGLTEQGEIVAPPVVVESLFKATVNALLQRELTARFAPVELQAYWGWLAFREGGDLSQRRAALARYREAGGDPLTCLELEAWLAYREGKSGQAAQLYQRLAAETGSLRARNHAIALTGML